LRKNPCWVDLNRNATAQSGSLVKNLTRLMADSLLRANGSSAERSSLQAIYRPPFDLSLQAIMLGADLP